MVARVTMMGTSVEIRAGRASFNGFRGELRTFSAKPRSDI
jgi:hypothetical protein